MLRALSMNANKILKTNATTPKTTVITILPNNHKATTIIAVRMLVVAILKQLMINATLEANTTIVTKTKSQMKRDPELDVVKKNP